VIAVNSSIEMVTSWLLELYDEPEVIFQNIISLNRFHDGFYTIFLNLSPVTFNVKDAIKYIPEIISEI
jgi:hypothetical protein